HNAAARAETVLVELDGPKMKTATVLTGPVPGRHEKNWMPFVASGELHFVYSCTPTAILACDLTTGATRLVFDEPGPPEARSFRGGSQGLELDAGRLFLVHEALDSIRGRTYLHRFVLFDRTNRLTAVSCPFCFAGPGVEFCAGIARRGKDLLLTFGVGDHSAGIAVAQLDE